MRFSGIRPDLGHEDEVVKQKLATCFPLAYSELIKSNIPGFSGSRSSRPATLRPSPPSIMKFSHDGPPVVKPTKGELLARVETLSRRSRSVKRKALNSLEKGRPAWGKVPRLGMSSSSLLPMFECMGKCRYLRPRFLEPQVLSPILVLLQMPKLPRGGLLSLC